MTNPSNNKLLLLISYYFILEIMHIVLQICYGKIKIGCDEKRCQPLLSTFSKNVHLFLHFQETTIELTKDKSGHFPSTSFSNILHLSLHIFFDNERWVGKKLSLIWKHLHTPPSHTHHIQSNTQHNIKFAPLTSKVAVWQWWYHSKMKYCKMRGLRTSGF